MEVEWEEIIYDGFGKSTPSLKTGGYVIL